MKKKILLIFIILIFIIIDIITGIFIFFDYLAERKTIVVESQGEYIVEEIKEHFKIDYNISKITFMSGIPDGYYLDVCDENNVLHSLFEDEHEQSAIYYYFNDVKPDQSKYKIFLSIEIIIEFIIIKHMIKGKCKVKE